MLIVFEVKKMKKDLFGLGKGYLIVVLGLLAVSGYADLSRSSDLILDARHEGVVWFANTENCVERSVSSGVSLSAVWSGDLTFLRTERKVITPYDEQQEILTPKKCEGKTENGTDDLSCFDVTYVNETKYRTYWLSFGSDAKAVDLSSIASELEEKTRDALSTAESSEKTKEEETIRFCFRTGEKTGQAHISYIALTDSEYASDESTDVNITSQSLNWQPPTPANNSAVIINQTQVNVSIETDHLDTFQFDWNGTNISIYDNGLVFYAPFNNVSGVDNSTTAFDISANNYAGTLTGTSYVTGKYGLAAKFTGGGSSEINFGSTPNLNFDTNSNFSFGGWVNVGYMDNNDRYALLKGNVVCSRHVTQFIFDVYNPNLNAGLDVSCVSGYSVPIPISLNTWYFVVVTYNGNTKNVSAYVNGIYNGSRVVSVTGAINDGGNFKIGTYGGGSPSKSFNGSVDDVFVYSRILSASEISLLYQSEMQKYNSSEYQMFVNKTSLSQGIYAYSAWANDTGGNSASTDNSTLRYLTYDTSYPLVSLVDPANNSAWTASSWVNFTYNVSQAYSDISYCNLTVNNSVLNSSSNITKDINQTLYANLSNGNYTWSVNCTGQNGLMNWSATYNVSMATTTTTTTTTLCSLGLGCGSCTGWVYLNSTSGTLQVLDADNNTKYDRVCCGGTVSNYTRY
jgi:hypothetical protein